MFYACADKHSHAVHHRTTQSAHLTITQTSPFADWLTVVCRHVLFPQPTSLLGTSPSALPTVNQGLANLLIATTIPLLFTFTLYSSQPPCLFASNQQPINVAQPAQHSWCQILPLN
jgi:hypothetical protein